MYLEVSLFVINFRFHLFYKFLYLERYDQQAESQIQISNQDNDKFVPTISKSKSKSK